MSYALLGKDDAGNKIEVFLDDRQYHTYLVGSTGYGKTQLMTHLVLEDAKLLNPKQGLLVLDPLGGLVDNIISFLPANRLDDVVLLSLDASLPVWGVNLYECKDIKNLGEVDKTMERVMRVWSKIYGITRETPLLATLMRNLSYAIIFNPPRTMIDIPRVLDEKPFRQQLVANIPLPNVKRFWERFDKLYPRDLMQEIDTVMRRFDDFLIPTFEPIIGQYKSTIDFVRFMNEGKIVLVRMNPELPAASELMGSVLLSLLLQAAYARPVNERKQFNLYVDEFQNFAGKEFSILYENARQFKLGALVSHQHRSQIPPDLADLAESLMQASTFICLQNTPQTARELSAKFDTTPPEPPMEETGRRKKQVPVTDVVGHLLRVGHRVSLVNRFVSSILQPLKLQSEDREYEENHKHLDIEQNSIVGYGTARKKLAVLNEFLYQCMTREQPDISLIARALVIIEGPPHGNPYYLAAFEDGFQSYWEAGIQEPYFSQVRKFIREMNLHGIIRGEMEKIIGLLRKELNYLVPQTPEGYKPYIPIVKQKYELMKKPSWFDIDVSKIDVEIRTITWRSRESYELWYSDKTQTYLDISPGQERKCYKEEDIAPEIEKIMPLDYPDFLDAISDLKTLQLALRKYPILADSGEEETILRPGQRQTPDQVRDAITNELTHLPPGRARVRLKRQPPNLQSKVCHRCGKVNPLTETLCAECKIPLRPEYLIELAKPSGNFAPLEPRVQRIIENNLRQGYLRKREDVEQEIATRLQPPNEPPQPPSGSKPKTPPTQPTTPAPMKRQNKIL